MAIAQFSGLASGIDSGALIDAMIEAREQRNNLRRDEIEFLQSENDSLEELNTKLLALDDLISKFRSSNGYGVAKKGNSSDSTVATATVSSTALNASYTLDVQSVANSATGSFDNSYASADAVVSAASGNVSVTVGTGADQVVISAAVTGGSTTLTQLANSINSDPNAEGRVVASVINVGTQASPQHRLMITTLESGTDKGSLALAADPALTELQGSTVSQATNAVFTVSGISGSITRASNSVDNVISGVSFNILNTGTTNISIANDPDSTAEELGKIVESYNELVKFIAENDTVTRVENDRNATNVFGSLAKTRVDNDFLNSFRTALSSANASGGTSVTKMSELGLSTNRDGTISFDMEKFREMALQDARGATSVLNDFADRVSGVAGTIHQYTRLHGFIDMAQEANNSQIQSLNNSIQNLERQTEKQRHSLTMRFANLEKITGDLQSQQQALTGILAGLGG